MAKTLKKFKIKDTGDILKLRKLKNKKYSIKFNTKRIGKPIPEYKQAVQEFERMKKRIANAGNNAGMMPDISL